MSDEADFSNYGVFSLGLGVQAWFPIFDPQFDKDHWQRIGVFPLLTRGASGQGEVPVKVTIVEEDWEIDENLNAVCWVLVRNLTARFITHFTITAIKVPNR
jgi:hypothetical protein